MRGSLHARGVAIPHTGKHGGTSRARGNLLCFSYAFGSTRRPSSHKALVMKGGAGDETRTRDIFLGKEVLYQLSYTRESGREI
jgi:hypothetical protein